MASKTFQIVFTPWVIRRLEQYQKLEPFLPRKYRRLRSVLNKLLPEISRSPFGFPLEPEISEQVPFYYGLSGTIKVIFYPDRAGQRVIIVEICALEPY